ncbi:MAG: ORF6N domain-containing protein [Candidatus Omnitrophica bacterium]|nr:ORF6N domain-containing protein [Candidatus Omnitrophota bacterium]
MKELIPQGVIENKIYLIRGHKVMLDKDLSALYGVKTKNLNKAIKRNIKRFPGDFMFQLTADEFMSLRFQNGTSKEGRGGRRYLPYVFTEQGVAMLSSILNSERAIEVNIAIMRAFVRLRDILLTHKDLAAKIAALELKYKNHDMKFSEYDKHIAAIFDAIRQLMAPPPEKPKRRLGFRPARSTE